MITAEAKGESWLQRSWRPLVMLTFTALVVCRWLGWTAPGLTEAVELKLLGIVQLGLGGYIASRGGGENCKMFNKTSKRMRFQIDDFIRAYGTETLKYRT